MWHLNTENWFTEIENTGKIWFGFGITCIKTTVRIEITEKYNTKNTDSKIFENTQYTKNIE